MTKSAYDRFVASMNITYMKWHDGEGYDIAAIAEMDKSERAKAEILLLNRGARDWRDLDALAALDTPKARALIRETRKSKDPHLRLHAANLLEHEDDGADEREAAIVHGIETGTTYTGLTQALWAAEKHPTQKVKDALFRASLAREGGVAVHTVALLFLLYGVAKEAFDWEYRPFFLKFHATGAERRALFLELCEKLGVDPKKYL